MVQPEYRIREIRNQKKLSGVEVAEKLGISPQYYYDIEKGKKNLSADNAVQLAKIFNVSVDYLLGKEEDNHIQTPKPYYSLNDKDEHDIAKMLEEMMEGLGSNKQSFQFMGEPMDEEDRELLRISLENTLRMSKQMAKKKFTPKKYRDEG